MCSDKEYDYEHFIIDEYYEILAERESDYLDVIYEYQEEWEIDG